ncbi:hypothetical protein ACHHYP_02562 [Achlya hypogyna]|uniref:Uncharacterized protein n=1 Tax=Achlya hypogyna TaxID=1202772 RepID=A0A1V9Z647_ACHHY|nr:hypothetical protein ACHHYP_02562 [Achlya hypogyna]
MVVSSLDGPAYMVLPHEAEVMVEQLQVVNVEALGAANWMSLHSAVEKLNLQAHQSAKQKADNFVVEALLTFKKLDVIVRNLLATELWKDEVFPLLRDFSDAASLRTYFILYHEAVLGNLLEVALYHEHVFEALDDDVLVEVLDYAMRKVTWLLSTPRDVFKTKTTFHKSGAAVVAELSGASRAEELARQSLEIDFRIAVQCVTILRYVCERVGIVSLTVLTRLLDKHDVLLSLTALIENPPWTYKHVDPATHEATWKKFHDQKWSIVAPSDLLQLTTTEAQPWIALYFLLCSKASRDQYQLTTFRKTQLLRVRKYLNDVLLDQLPLLADVQRFLDELAIVNLPPSSVLSASKLVMEALPVLRSRLLRQYKNEYPVIAAAFVEACSTLRRADDMEYLADVYNLAGIEDLLDDNVASPETPVAPPTTKATTPMPPVGPPRVSVLPTAVHIALVARTNPAHKIVEIGADDEVYVECSVAASSEKSVATAHGTYVRFTLEKASASPTKVPSTACLDATVVLASNAKMQLHCADIALPDTMAPVWRQAGTLDDGQGILQVQFKWDADVKGYSVASIFLSLPATPEAS